jgi:hypothetical protein
LFLASIVCKLRAFEQLDLETESETAQVVAVDAATRTVTLKAATGETVDVVAGDAVRNFAQIKLGDNVVAVIERSLTYIVSPRGPKLPPAARLDQAGRTAPGAKPGAAVARSTAITATLSRSMLPPRRWTWSNGAAASCTRSTCAIQSARPICRRSSRAIS